MPPRWRKVCGAQAAVTAMCFSPSSAPESVQEFLIDGNIYYGRTGAAGEGGHMTIDYKGPRCGCGKLGCVEALVAGPAIAKRARAKIEAQPSAGTALLQLAGGNLDLLTSENVGKAYANGDPLAREVLLDTVELLAICLAT